MLAHGKNAEALRHAEQNPIIDDAVLANVYLANDRYADAVEVLRREVADSPDNLIMRASLANALALMGSEQEALDVFRALREDGLLGSVADFERGVRTYWGTAEFGDVQVAGLKRLPL